MSQRASNGRPASVDLWWAPPNYLSGSPEDVKMWTGDWHETTLPENESGSYVDAIEQVAGRWTDFWEGEDIYIRFEYEEDLVMFKLRYNGPNPI